MTVAHLLALVVLAALCTAVTWEAVFGASLRRQLRSERDRSNRLQQRLTHRTHGLRVVNRDDTA